MQSKKAMKLANISYSGKPQAGDVLISSFLPSTGGPGPEPRLFKSQAEGQGSLRQTILYDYNNKARKSKSKKQFQHKVKIGFLPSRAWTGWIQLTSWTSALNIH